MRIARKLLFQSAFIMLSGVLSPAALLAGGLTQYEVATPDVGYASAGYAARANDPGTVLTNPAGMTRLKGSQLQVGAQLLYGDVAFQPEFGTTTNGSYGDNALGPLPALSAFGTYSVNPNISIGIGMFSNFGLGLWYDSNWVGRYYVKNAILMGMSVMPAIACRFNEHISVGAGVNLMYGYLRQTVAINNPDPTIGDGQLKVKDGTLGVGGNIGVLYEVSPRTRFGVTYTTPIKLRFEDTPEFSGTGPGISSILLHRGAYFNTLNLNITVPQAVMASFYHEFNDTWALLGNFGWQDWSEFGKVDVSFSSTEGPGLTTNLKYNDTWHGAIGAQYRLAEPWLLTAGVAYDSSMLDNSNRSPSLPIGWTWRFALGAQYDMSKDLRLGFAYEYVYSGSPRINVSRGPLAGTVIGEYPDMSVQYFSANINWKF
jgi:long-chain fatty acid transport protein